MFELLDVKWGKAEFGTPSGTINWSAELGGLPTDGGVTEADLDAALQLAFDAWEAVAAVDFEQVSSGGQVSVTYEAMGVTPGGTIAGVASWGPDVSGALNSLSVGIIKFNSDLSWSPNGSASSIDFYAIALHEVGHIIGLDHVTDSSQIMNALVSADDLGNGDIDGAQFIYGTGSGAAASPSGGGGGGGGGGAIALLLGLLALIAGVFTGGGGGAVAMAAAGHVPDQDSGPDGENALDYLPELPVDVLAEALVVSHPVYLPEVTLADGVTLPIVDHESQPSACGCFGHCAHTDVDPEDLFDWA